MQVNCPSCGAMFDADFRTRVLCCGHRIKVNPTVSDDEAAQDRRRRSMHLNRAMERCRECEHRSAKGCGGCQLYAIQERGKRPCDATKAIMKGSGCFDKSAAKFPPCSSTPLQWRGWKQPSMDDHCIAVTSLSGHSHHLERQAVCLESWRDIGLTIASLNTSDEVEHLQSLYPQVTHWIVNNENGSDYAKPTQRIKDMAMVASTLNRTVLLINSDIELYGDQSTIIDPLERGEQTMVIRWNYDDNLDDAQREQHGIDAFSFTPAQAIDLPDLPLSIGRPFFDYWIPYHSRQSGLPMHFVGERFAWHQRHELNWSEDDWFRGAEWFCEHYGEDFDFMRAEFRGSLPFPPR